MVYVLHTPPSPHHKSLIFISEGATTKHLFWAKLSIPLLASETFTGFFVANCSQLMPRRLHYSGCASLFAFNSSWHLMEQWVAEIQNSHAVGYKYWRTKGGFSTSEGWKYVQRCVKLKLASVPQGWSKCLECPSAKETISQCKYS